MHTRHDLALTPVDKDRTSLTNRKKHRNVNSTDKYKRSSYANILNAVARDRKEQSLCRFAL